MTAEPLGMTIAGVAALGAGLILAVPRLRQAEGAQRILLLGAICDAVALAMFSAEHYTAPRDLMPIVPHWLPWHLFWVCFVGTAWLATAISLVLWRSVRWSATLAATMLLIIVVTLDPPGFAKHFHERFYWILTVREMSFAAGLLVLAGSVWPRGRAAGKALVRIGRGIVAPVMIFYAVEHFLHPRFVPGVPLEKPIPAWFPAPVLLSVVVGIVLLLGGIGLFIRPRIAAASAGAMLVLLTAFFYVPILLTEIHTPLVVEGLNYVGDTLLFAGTVLLAGLGTDQRRSAQGELNAPRLVDAERVSYR